MTCDAEYISVAGVGKIVCQRTDRHSTHQWKQGSNVVWWQEADGITHTIKAHFGPS